MRLLLLVLFRNLVFTLPGERFFNQNLGSKVSKFLFENMDEISASVIKDEIENTINNYEPRVDLILLMFLQIMIIMNLM
jgi:phage baseplate assembly protein W